MLTKLTIFDTQMIVPKEVATLARQIQHAESLLRSAIEQGSTLKQPREQLSHHSLQRGEQA